MSTLSQLQGQSRHQAWIDYRDQQDERLYERYGRPLEAEHAGQFVAISDGGEIILGSDLLNVTMEAVKQFGAGAYALRRVGHDAELRMWVTTA